MDQSDGTNSAFPEGFDHIYFMDATWADRVKRWVDEHHEAGFSHGNVSVIRQILSDQETGLRMVVNITADALLSFLNEGVYKNLYDHPVIGEEPKIESDRREEVDQRLRLTKHHYFGAVALGGAGVRYYGEYCMVVGLDRVRRVSPDTRLFDRDSYDILLEPLADLELSERQIQCLRGTWDTDVVEMALLRVLPEIEHDIRLVTSGTISELVLRDQEFIEIHLDGTFEPDDLEEIRESPDDASLELAIAERERHGLFTTVVDREWARRRAAVARQLEVRKVPHRVVTLHGRGYQWK